MRRLLVLLALALLVTACSDDEPDLATDDTGGGETPSTSTAGPSTSAPAPPPEELTGVRWTLVSITEGTDAQGSASTVGAEAWIELGEDGRLGANYGCNTGGGDYAVEGDQLLVGALMATRMACSDTEQMRVEAAMMAVLGGDPTFVVDGDRLELASADGGLVFTAT
jgi:heat shock protein HslJ